MAEAKEAKLRLALCDGGDGWSRLVKMVVSVPFVAVTAALTAGIVGSGGEGTCSKVTNVQNGVVAGRRSEGSGCDRRTAGKSFVMRVARCVRSSIDDRRSTCIGVFAMRLCNLGVMECYRSIIIIIIIIIHM